MIKDTGHYSKRTGRLAKGCRLCVAGRKSVLFVTGLCPRSCYFCPISEQKYHKDVMYINEWETNDVRNIITEIQLCSSQGAGITGGDPLAVVERTESIIRKLKEHFGEEFHIHLYTSFNLATEENLKRLNDAGLDEIRFHADLDKPEEWKTILRALDLDWDVGVEIPAIPGKHDETVRLIDFMSDKIKFLNINELEISDTNAQHLVERGFKTKDNISYGVRGSEEMALKLLEYCRKKGLNAHYCTTRLKDKVQLAKRIALRAKKVKKKYDSVTEEGMLVRGAVYKVETKEDLKKAKESFFAIDLEDDEFYWDEKRKRMLTYGEAVMENSEKLKKIGFSPALVEEYPTADCMNVETIFL
jgi:hypothetical protein